MKNNRNLTPKQVFESGYFTGYRSKCYHRWDDNLKKLYGGTGGIACGAYLNPPPEQMENHYTRQNKAQAPETMWKIWSRDYLYNKGHNDLRVPCKNCFRDKEVTVKEKFIFIVRDDRENQLVTEDEALAELLVETFDFHMDRLKVV